MPTKSELIKSLALTEHREGGFYKRTYQSPTTIQTNRQPPERYLLTSIFYMLTEDKPIGYFHINRSDIIHYFQLGSPIIYLTISPEGILEKHILGPDISQGHCLQLIVKGGYWKASMLETGEFGLLSEAVAPGFDYKDAEMATPATFKKLFPSLWDTISSYVLPE